MTITMNSWHSFNHEKKMKDVREIKDLPYTQELISDKEPNDVLLYKWPYYDTTFA